MSLTMPQLILLNHASSVNRERAEKSYEAKKAAEERKSKQEEDDPIVWAGKRLSEMTTSELMMYYGDFQQ